MSSLRGIKECTGNSSTSVNIENRRKRDFGSSPSETEKLHKEFTKTENSPLPKLKKLEMKASNFPKPGITIKLNASKSKTEANGKISVANAFKDESDDEVEEMPAECRMRMRNIGRDTPTSSGPNSFGKTKQGFMDSKKMFEKSLKEASVD